MWDSVVKSALVGIACVAAFASGCKTLGYPADCAHLRGAPGAWARYEVVGAEAKSGVSHIVVSTPVQAGNRRGVWFQLEAFAGETRLYALALKVSSLEFLRPEGTEVKVSRYILFPAEGRPLEYVSKRAQEALLPPFDFWKSLMPHAAGAGEPLPSFSEGVYLGRPIRLVARGAHARLLPVDKARRLELDPDVLIGTSRNFKETEGRRMYSYGTPEPPGSPDYTYTPLTAEDYRILINDVGMNRFPVAHDQLPYVIDQPVFFLLGEKLGELPDLLYRSNYSGLVQFMDEPVWIAIATHKLDDVKMPQEAASRVVEIVRQTYQSADYGGVRCLAQAFKQAGGNFADADVRAGDFPVWETSPSGAWYELEAGAPGYVYEGRFRPPSFAKFMKEKLDVDFPADVRMCAELHYAFFRGAARRFGGRWGVAIYGQMALESAAQAFSQAYDEGATYFWFWTSDHSHHVVFAEQKQLTRQFREYMAAHPRKASPEELTASARVAVALPWGYPFGDHDLNPGMLWWSPNMRLESDNGHGATYKAVLKAAMDEAVRLLKEKIPFDFVFLREGERAAGYAEVYRVQEDGKVVLE